MTFVYDNAVYIDSIDTNELDNVFLSWKEKFPKGGVLAFVAEQDAGIVYDLQKKANASSVPIVGAIFPELIVESALKKQGVLLLRFDVMPSHCIVPLSVDDLVIKQAVMDISCCIDLDMDDRSQSLFMIFDAMIPNISSIIDEAYLKLGDSVNYMGANAGTQAFQSINCLFDNKVFIADAVIAIVLKGHGDSVLEHGYINRDISTFATSTTKNRISCIDWRPAFEVYQELALKHYNVHINRQNFYELAVHFPLGIVRMDGELLVRIPVAIDADGSIVCAGEIPENSVLSLLKAVSLNSLQTIDVLVDKLSKQSKKTVLSFYCAGRRMHMEDASLIELSLLNKKLPDCDITGALSLGEICGAKQGGYPLFHNASILVIPWS